MIKKCEYCGKRLKKKIRPTGCVESWSQLSRRRFCNYDCAVSGRRLPTMGNRGLDLKKVIKKVKAISSPGLQHRVAKIVFWDFSTAFDGGEMIEKYRKYIPDEGVYDSKICDEWPEPAEVMRCLVEDLGYSEWKARTRLGTYTKYYKNHMAGQRISDR